MFPLKAVGSTALLPGRSLEKERQVAGLAPISAAAVKPGERLRRRALVRS